MKNVKIVKYVFYCATGVVVTLMWWIVINYMWHQWESLEPKFTYEKFTFSRDIKNMDAENISWISFMGEKNSESCSIESNYEIELFVNSLKQGKRGFTSHVLPVEEYLVTINFKNSKPEQFRAYIFDAHLNDLYIKEMPYIDGDSEWWLNASKWVIEDGRFKLQEIDCLFIEAR